MNKPYEWLQIGSIGDKEFVMNKPIDYIQDMAGKCDPEKATFDQLAEEVLELHLALRGKHGDSPAYEWLQIGSIAANALALLSEREVIQAWKQWNERHYQEEAKMLRAKG